MGASFMNFMFFWRPVNCISMMDFVNYYVLIFWQNKVMMMTMAKSVPQQKSSNNHICIQGVPKQMHHGKTAQIITHINRVRQNKYATTKTNFSEKTRRFFTKYSPVICTVCLH